MTCLNCGARLVVGGPAFFVRAGVAWCVPCDQAAQAAAAANRAAALAAIAAVRQPSPTPSYLAGQHAPSHANKHPHGPGNWTRAQRHFGRDWPGGARGQHSGSEVRR